MTGSKKDYYENGTLRREIPFTGGKINGMFKQYYESGKLEKEVPFTDSIENGVETDYYESGKVQVVEGSLYKWQGNRYG